MSSVSAGLTRSKNGKADPRAPEAKMARGEQLQLGVRPIQEHATGPHRVERSDRVRVRKLRKVIDREPRARVVLWTAKLGEPRSELLKRKWREESNYNWVCDQFKSMRQDLIVRFFFRSFPTLSGRGSRRLAP
jgi:hypothetical protein